MTEPIDDQVKRCTPQRMLDAPMPEPLLTGVLMPNGEIRPAPYLAKPQSEWTEAEAREYHMLQLEFRAMHDQIAKGARTEPYPQVPK